MATELGWYRVSRSVSVPSGKEEAFHMERCALANQFTLHCYRAYWVDCHEAPPAKLVGVASGQGLLDSGSEATPSRELSEPSADILSSKATYEAFRSHVPNVALTCSPTLVP